MLKREIRALYPKLRTELPQDILREKSLDISNQLLKLQVWDAEYFHIFLPISEKKEVDTSYIIPVLQGRDKHVIIPKVTRDGELSHFLLSDNTRLVKNKWNIPEPENGIQISETQIDVVFLPMLAFDREGYRVGYGKGFYDRFLEKCREDVIKIGLSFFGPVDRISDREMHDIPMDFCLTPDEIYSFSNSSR
ncbi:5-formyltetrahydrofolate cyclo-ligase [Lentiprolixibacter aurantiacus]|uniref:5-formyltetrahydrofolate cyclo-ligase n=1 Tax=Lentiprolixibacter aurantiacus TaxID=2993939 RepID=A0AAE3MJF3_9FLAO|nr:5-formyltetrahydrofolate cyclo-ligase [Lentiprolixibacter aurantiacus]MCX2718328.1 5-formyltetrahydrofolate cyclo-ligase [Lentiprolixibacter aurantiacus]